MRKKKKSTEPHVLTLTCGSTSNPSPCQSPTAGHAHGKSHTHYLTSSFIKLFPHSSSFLSPFQTQEKWFSHYKLCYLLCFSFHTKQEQRISIPSETKQISVAESSHLQQEAVIIFKGNGFTMLRILSTTLQNVPSQIHNLTAKSTVDLIQFTKNIGGNHFLVHYQGTSFSIQSLFFGISLILAKWVWEIFLCSFNALDFLQKYKGKKIMFVGDSLSLNQFNSLACMLHASVPNSRITFIKKNALSSVTFEVSFHNSVFFSFYFMM